MGTAQRGEAAGLHHFHRRRRMHHSPCDSRLGQCDSTYRHTHEGMELLKDGEGAFMKGRRSKAAVSAHTFARIHIMQLAHTTCYLLMLTLQVDSAGMQGLQTTG